MPLLRNAARAYLLNRALRGSRRHRRSTWRGGYYAPPRYYPRRRSSSGFHMRGPFPTYSRHTRGGSRVSVTGCCLPIPLGLTVAAIFGIGRRLRAH